MSNLFGASEGAYSFSLTTFSPTGKLKQLEHALAAVAKGKLSVGIRAKNGAVIATEKITEPLVEASEFHKIHTVHKACGLTYAGMGTDVNVLIKKARKKAQAYYSTFHELEPVQVLVKELGDVMQQATQSGGVRPYGVSLLVAGWDDKGPHLYQIDPSGLKLAWKATAIGRGFQSAKSFLERRYNEGMELEDAIHTAILTLKENFEGEMNKDNVEIALVESNRKFRVLTSAEVQDYLDETE